MLAAVGEDVYLTSSSADGVARRLPSVISYVARDSAPAVVSFSRALLLLLLLYDRVRVDEDTRVTGVAAGGAAES